MADTVEELRRLVEAEALEWSVYDGPLRSQFPTRIIEIYDNNDGVVLAWIGFDSADGTHDEKLGRARLIIAAVNGLPALLDRLEKAEHVVEAAQALVTRLDEVHESSEYAGVWSLWQNHFGPYAGPTYIEAKATTCTALQALSTEVIHAE